MRARLTDAGFCNLEPLDTNWWLPYRAVQRRLNELLDERREWYEQADVHVRISARKEPSEVAVDVLDSVKSRLEEEKRGEGER